MDRDRTSARPWAAASVARRPVDRSHGRGHEQHRGATAITYYHTRREEQDSSSARLTRVTLGAHTCATTNPPTLGSLSRGSRTPPTPPLHHAPHQPTTPPRTFPTTPHPTIPPEGPCSSLSATVSLPAVSSGPSQRSPGPSTRQCRAFRQGEFGELPRRSYPVIRTSRLVPRPHL